MQVRVFHQLLPPANEVCGKVMLLYLSVSHSVHGGALYDVTSCLAAWSHVPSRGLCLDGSLSGGVCGEGVSVKGGLCERGQKPPSSAATRAHTGMHSC